MYIYMYICIYIYVHMLNNETKSSQLGINTNVCEALERRMHVLPAIVPVEGSSLGAGFRV